MVRVFHATFHSINTSSALAFAVRRRRVVHFPAPLAAPAPAAALQLTFVSPGPTTTLSFPPTLSLSFFLSVCNPHSLPSRSLPSPHSIPSEQDTPFFLPTRRIQDYPRCVNRTRRAPPYIRGKPGNQKRVSGQLVVGSLNILFHSKHCFC